MNPYYLQYQINEELYLTLKESQPDKYFDWKITILFYSTIHLIKALAYKHNLIIGENHADIFYLISDQELDFKKHIKKDYRALFNYSRTTRYFGCEDFESHHQAHKKNLEEAEKKYERIKEYIMKIRKLDQE